MVYDEFYNEGYSAYLNGESDIANPYMGLEAEYWLDGWEDAQAELSEKTHKAFGAQCAGRE